MSEANERIYGPGSIAASDQHVSEMAAELKKSPHVPSLLVLGHEDGTQVILNFAGSIQAPIGWDDDDPRLKQLQQTMLVEFLGESLKAIQKMAFQEMERMMSE